MLSEMTKRERLLTAFQGKKPDRVPISAFHWSVAQRKYSCFCWMHELKLTEEFDWDPLIRLNTLAKPEHIYHNYIYNPGSAATHQYHTLYEDIEEVSIDLHIERQKDKTIVTRIIHTPKGTLQDKIIQPKSGCGYGWLPMPHWEEKLIKNEEDLEKIKYILNCLPQKNKIEDAKEIIKHVGEQGLVTTTMYSPLSYLAGDAVGSEQLLVLYYDNKAFFKHLLGIFQDYSFKTVKPYLEIGIKVVFLDWYYHSFSAGWSPEIWEEIFFPLLKKQVDFVHSYGALVDYYDDGKVKQLLPFLKRAGIDCLGTLVPPPVGDTTLKRAREYFGHEISLKGGIDTVYTLQKGSKKDIEESVYEAIEDAGKDVGYILYPSDPITAETPFENIRYFVEAGKRFGDYSKR